MRNSSKIRGFKLNELTVLLSLYADDCSIFLEYDSINLKNAIEILKDFYRLSGLEIHLKKTQCIIIGNNNHYPPLCPELELDWGQKFKLLGVHFDADTLDYNSNLEAKLKEINSIINDWRHRFLTPIGRACIAKTLLLSKINHLAFVLPSLTKRKIREIENIIYRFIWKGSDKVARNDAKLKWGVGGLNLPDIENSWTAFKLSWFRRMQNSQGKWVKIFLSIARESANISDVYDLFLKISTTENKCIAKNISSVFWKECVQIVEPFMRVFLEKIPEEILNSRIWGLHLIRHRGRIVKSSDFPIIASKCQFIKDLFKTNDNGSISFLTNAEMIHTYGFIPEWEITSLRQHIREIFMQKNLNPNTLQIDPPFRPAIYYLLNTSKKGCGKWTNLKKKKWSTQNIKNREIKWERELGRVQGVPFWDRCYKNTSLIYYDNRIKWLQYQIVRGTLKTNKIVAKFKANVDANCSFCHLEIENISHLFWNCPMVKTFINDVSELSFVQNPAYHIENDLKSFIFCNKDSTTSPNMILKMYMKYYIWIIRCNNNSLNIRNFINWFNKEINILRTAYQGSDLDSLTNILL